MVLPEELTNALVHSQYKSESCRLHEQERDFLKHWKSNNLEIALLGIEKQTEIDKRMPLRIFGYEGTPYRSQYRNESIEPVIL
ncbi:MAG: hypothetical protein ACI4E1_12155 [Lachnospira sp.]